MQVLQSKTLGIRKCFIYLVAALIVFMVSSRLFTETFGLLPKIVDVINYPFFVLTLSATVFCLFFRGACLKKFELILVVGFALLIISFLGNVATVYFPAFVLYVAGFYEGPLIFFVLTRLVGKDYGSSLLIQKTFLYLILINIAVVIFVSYPLYISSGGNPDLLSGTFGANAYYFSIFLVASLGAGVGLFYERRIGVGILFAFVSFVVGTFFLLQYRAALPFFLVVVFVFIYFMYSRNALRIFSVLGLLAVAAVSVVYMLDSLFDNSDRLKYGDFLDILDDPYFILQFGKFQSYAATMDMWGDEIANFFLGVGPGNYTSRSYYTFSYEFLIKDGSGVSGIIREYLGQTQPRFSPYDLEYISNFRSEIVFGSYQLSNPNSSYLTLLGELGFFGGFVGILLYFWLLLFSLGNLKESLRRHSSVGICAFAFCGTFFVFLLGFLDNYWEMARATLFIWVANWASFASLQDQHRGRKF
ncbi:hypothetical protein [uncultured Pseudoteredinibacter sp.]|uniref:hypothetical protein n=1 Tax=uncultured Pseudoteredinibacter sp. TaxID=1641701 RepID=UPI00260A90D3|nr:hypothetical protein [uncultured Pseudoteredinibacter sp.]